MKTKTDKELAKISKIKDTNKSRWDSYSEEEKERRREISRANGRKYWKNASQEQLKAHGAKIAPKRELWYDNLEGEAYTSYCNNISLGKKKYWANLSSDRYKEICASVSLGVHKQWSEMTDLQKKTRNDKISKFWSSLSSSAKEVYCQLLSTKHKAWWDSLTEKEYLDQCQALRKTELMKANHSKSALAYWKGLDQEAYSKHCMAIATSKRHKCYEIAGEIITFHSTWEYSLYCYFHCADVSFLFANKMPGTFLDLGGCFWSPDFIVGNDIIEVKGHPFAYDKFYRRDYPLFMLSDYRHTYTLYLCEYNTKNKKFSSYDSFLASCKLIHKP